MGEDKIFKIKNCILLFRRTSKCIEGKFFRYFLFGLLWISAVCSQRNKHTHLAKGYKIGDIVRYQCKDENGNWTLGFTCNDDKEMTFVFGKDHVFQCGWVLTESKLQRVINAIKNDERWSCRMEMAPNTTQWIPFSLPFWGLVERSHIHLINHFNFVFHANELGYILGVTGYPVFDQFQFVINGSTVLIHGVVKWFKGHHFKDLSSDSIFPIEGNGKSVWVPILMWSLVTFILSLVTAVLFYQFVLKPRLLRKLLKVE